MAGGSGKHEKGAEELGMVEKDPGIGGGQPEDVRDAFQGVSIGDVALPVRDVGDDPPHGTGPGKFSTQGSAADQGETAEETGGRGLGTSTAGGSNEVGRLRGDWGLYPKEEEHGRAIYCNATNSGPL